jgi:hypothetical protein
MHTTHVSSGGRYPVLRSLAILYLAAAVGVVALGIWRAINVFRVDEVPADVFGAATGTAGKMLVAASWLAASFIAALMMLGIAELMKLFIDIERNTRMAAMRTAAAEAGVGGTIAIPTGASANSDGAGGRMNQWLEGEETAEGALIRGH